MYTLTNLGPGPSDPFDVNVYLSTGIIPDTTDVFMDQGRERRLAAGESVTGEILTEIPEISEPGLFRVGVILDPNADTGDPSPDNNRRTSFETIEVLEEEVPVGLGARISGEFGPFGGETYALDLLAGTKLKLKATV